MKIKPLVAGNWKMHGASSQLRELRKLDKSLTNQSAKCEVLVCPPATLLAPAKGLRRVKLGGQDCHPEQSGAYTGDISAAMLRDAGAKAVIVGHSERREDYGETNQEVCAKVQAAHKAKLQAIVCVGESASERRTKKTLAVIRKQLKQSLPPRCKAANTIIAYEPIWAIGTGRTPTAQQIEEVHTAIRKELIKSFSKEGEKIRILYGGSVNPRNASALLSVPDVNGALVGGASLKARDFLKIIDTYGRGVKQANTWKQFYSSFT